MGAALRPYQDHLRSFMGLFSKLHPMTNAIYQSELPYLKLLFRGKVRDIYDLGDELLLVATDRLSAFDVVFPDPIPGKGEILTQLSLFWFEKLKDIIPHHLSKKPVEELFNNEADRKLYSQRSMRVCKTKPLPVEAIVRGYITGSGWSDYQKTGSVCGIRLPANLQESAKLEQPIFTPSTKAEAGAHDENISFETACQTLGQELAQKVRDISIALYSKARDYAETKGILIADTKFEFGLVDNQLVWIDEALTPDSSRFWPKQDYALGISPPSYDKQFVRNHVSAEGWNKKPPAPRLPQDIIEKTAAKYRQALDELRS